MQFHAQLQDHHFFSVLSKGLFDSFPVNLADRDAGSVHQACFLLIHPGNIAAGSPGNFCVLSGSVPVFRSVPASISVHRCLCIGTTPFRVCNDHGTSAPADIGNVPIQHTAFIAPVRVDGEVSASGAKTAEHPVKFFAKFFFLQGQCEDTRPALLFCRSVEGSVCPIQEVKIWFPWSVIRMLDAKV